MAATPFGVPQGVPPDDRHQTGRDALVGSAERAFAGTNGPHASAVASLKNSVSSSGDTVITQAVGMAGGPDSSLPPSPRVVRIAPGNQLVPRDQKVSLLPGRCLQRFADDGAFVDRGRLTDAENRPYFGTFGDMKRS